MAVRPRSGCRVHSAIRWSDPPLEGMSRSVDRNALVKPLPSRRVTVRSGCVGVHQGRSFTAGGVSTRKRNWEEGKRLERSVTLPSLSLGLSAVRFQFLLGVLLQIRILLQGGLRGYPFLHSRTESRIRLSACAGPLGANPRTENV